MSKRGTTQVPLEHENFVPVAKHRVVAALAGELNEGERDKFRQFCAIVESLYHFHFHRTSNELKEDFLLFDTKRGQREQQAYSGEELARREDRFLRNFLQVMEAGNFRPLSQADISLAEAADYLFALPVEIAWERLDDDLLTRYFAEHSYDGTGDDPPEFVHRILIFRRGTGIDCSTGFFILPKIDVVVTMVLKGLLGLPGRLWRLVRGEVGGEKREVRRETRSTAGSNGQAEGAASHRFKQRYVERISLRATGPSPLWLFRKTTLQEPTFKELIILYRPATPEALGPDELPPEKDRTIHIKAFRDIPMADLEVVFPEKKISMKPLDLIKVVVTGLAGVFVVAAKAVSQVAVNPALLLTALVTITGYASKVLIGFKVSRDRYQSVVTSSLYDKNLDNNLGVIFYLIDSLEEQEFKEAVLAYYFLWREGSCTLADLDARCEQYLHEKFGVEIDFEIHDALEKLIDEHLVERDGDRLAAVPINEALARLDAKWDGLFIAPTE